MSTFHCVFESTPRASCSRCSVTANCTNLIRYRLQDLVLALRLVATRLRWAWFAVCKKIGADAAAGAVFRSREPTGEIALQGGEEDLVLTRILWLDGLQEVNANTRERYIYIHGTNQEALLGTPASHGCVRMSNADIAECFDEIPEGTPVEIVA